MPVENENERTAKNRGDAPAESESGSRESSLRLLEDTQTPRSTAHGDSVEKIPHFDSLDQMKKSDWGKDVVIGETSYKMSTGSHTGSGYEISKGPGPNLLNPPGFSYMPSILRSDPGPQGEMLGVRHTRNVDGWVTRDAAIVLDLPLNDPETRGKSAEYGKDNNVQFSEYNPKTSGDLVRDLRGIADAVKDAPDYSRPASIPAEQWGKPVMIRGELHVYQPGSHEGTGYFKAGSEFNELNPKNLEIMQEGVDNGNGRHGRQLFTEKMTIGEGPNALSVNRVLPFAGVNPNESEWRKYVTRDANGSFQFTEYPAAKLHASNTQTEAEKPQESKKVSEKAYDAIPGAEAVLAANQSASEAMLEDARKLKSASEFTREMYESRQPVEIGGIVHKYVEGKGYVTDGPINLLNPPGSFMKNLGGNGPSGGYGNPGPFNLVQPTMVGEGESRRAADVVLPIPAFNPDKNTWGKEVVSQFPNPPLYKDLPAGSSEPIVPRPKVSSIPSDAINLTKGYPSGMGGLIGEHFNQTTDSRAERSNLAESAFPKETKLWNLRGQDDVNVAAFMDKQTGELRVINHPFNGALAGAIIKGHDFERVVAPAGTYPHVPGSMYNGAEVAGSASAAIDRAAKAAESSKGRIGEKAGLAVGALVLGGAALQVLSDKAQAKAYELPSFEITGK